MKVLIIDDDAVLRQSLRATLSEDGEWEVEDRGFEGVNDTLGRFRPDMVVLDLVEGESAVRQGEDSGNTSFDQIRRNWFCPVVVYSAFPDRKRFDHALVKTIRKGADTDVMVRNQLEEFIPTARIIQTVHDDFDCRVREALRDSVHALSDQLESTEGEQPQASVLRRAVRRLVAARVDLSNSEEGEFQAWERYVVPPLGNHLLTADLLRKEGARWTQEDAFRLVLTPSCDMAPHGGRTKGNQILVACCERIERLGKIKLEQGKALSHKQQVELRTILTGGSIGSHLPIPQFRGQVPLMAANLKRLELLDWNQVRFDESSDCCSTNQERFQRVASTDSPFRELVVWAYLGVTGRPGAPQIDIELWLEEISRHFTSGGRP